MNMKDCTIEQLQHRMEELTKAAREKELATELEHTSIDYNLSTLKQTITTKEEKVNNFYRLGPNPSVHCVVGNRRDGEEIVHLSAIYNILSIMNTRLSKLEEVLVEDID